MRRNAYAEAQISDILAEAELSARAFLWSLSCVCSISTLYRCLKLLLAQIGLGGLGYVEGFALCHGSGRMGFMTALEGKVALVTGASRGIGAAIAKELGALGATVVVSARTEAPRDDIGGTIGETVHAIVDAGGRALTVKADLLELTDIDRLVADASSLGMRPIPSSAPKLSPRTATRRGRLAACPPAPRPST